LPFFPENPDRFAPFPHPVCLLLRLPLVLGPSLLKVVEHPLRNQPIRLSRNMRQRQNALKLLGNKDVSCTWRLGL